jgi:hypothetical protein
MPHYRLLALMLLACSARAEWAAHSVFVINAPEPPIALRAEHQVVTESWNRVTAVPSIVYMPERDRLLLLLSCDYPHQAMVLNSSDHGATWSSPRYVHPGPTGTGDTGMGYGITYLGGGEVILMAGQRWFSEDYGATWEESQAIPPLPDGSTWNGWEPIFVDRGIGGQVSRLIETGYGMNHENYHAANGPGYSTGHLRESLDHGRTWGAPLQVPEWTGFSEVHLVRAGNGDLVAACRTDIPLRFNGQTLDHYEGLAVSRSADNGKTWSTPHGLYDHGRHHPSMVLLPNGDLVMTYVVRMGYTAAGDGLPRFGIEAVISQDHGLTWDLDHKYVLDAWIGNRTGDNAWWASSQATSTVLLPDGSLLTAYGTGYRSEPNAQNLPAPRDVAMVRWNLSDQPLNSTRAVRDAAIVSDTRNVFDPTGLIAARGTSAPPAE